MLKARPILMGLAFGSESQRVPWLFYLTQAEGMVELGHNQQTQQESYIMKTPRINEVWYTRSGNLAIIVDCPEHDAKGCYDAHNAGMALLWYDQISGELTVSPILDRLDYQSALRPSDVFTIWYRG